MARDVRDKVMIITGASAGIGAATARLCSQAGMYLLLNARRADKLEQVASEIRAAGGKVATFVGDVTVAGHSTRLLDEARNAFGGFDVVFANAGYGLERPIHRMSGEEWRAIFEANFFAATDLLQHAAQRLLEQQQSGHLLMTSSCLARLTMPAHGAYTATKSAQHHVCRAMRMELRPFGIQVSSVHPVGTRTEFFDEMEKRGGDDWPVSAKQPPSLFMQPPERVARAVLRCLRKPRPEVWTSFSFRVIAALMTVFPRMMDRVAQTKR